MKIKNILALSLSAVLLFGTLSGCGQNSNTTTDSTKTGSVYFLNFKPEVATVWEEIGKAYTEETGIPVKIQTAAAGTYEQTLKSEIAKKDAPTLFQVNGPIGYDAWKDYCLDLKDTQLYSWLLDKSLAIKGGETGEGVYGIPYVVEGYGVIYNSEIMDKYFALTDKVASVSSADEIKNFATLKAVVDDMTAKKAELGIDGVFASTSLKPGEDWRWHTHLANVPINYEYKDNGVNDMAEIQFKYADNYKNLFDLYINNSITEPKMLGSKSVDDSMAEFALGKVAMIQNGNWAWNQINGVSGNVVKAENTKFMPMYTGISGEEAQGLCTGTENFIAVNSKASKENQDASIAFMEWVFSSDKGKDFVTNKLGFISPFNTFGETEVPNDPLAKEVIRFMSNQDLASVSWAFSTFPSQTFKDNFGASLLEYSQGKKEWKDVVSQMVEDWKYEKEANQ